MNEFSVVSLFSGCGGLDLGFTAMGGRVVYACDSSKHAVACYRWNFGDHCHVRDVTSKEFSSDLNTLDSTDVILGGFPCQGFSKAGTKRKDDSRNALYLSMQAAVLRLKPLVFVAENVDGIQQNYGGEFVSRVREGFVSSDVEYKVYYTILDAAHYGVPQHRRRAFFVGVRSDLSQAGRFVWPTNTHRRRTRNGEFAVPSAPLFQRTAGPLPAPQSLRDAIGDLAEADNRVPDHVTTERWPSKYQSIIKAIGPGQKLCNVRHASTSVYTWEIPEAFGPTSERQRIILDTISKNRRHKKYGDIPNGNPLPVAVIAGLSGLPEDEVIRDCLVLEDAGYLKQKLDGYDLKGAMFCSGLFKRPRWDEPSPTVLTNFHNPRYFIHPEFDRPFTLRECARIQSFPDSFQFLASKIPITAGYRLVGNAVPPRLAEAIARSVKDLLKSNLSHRKTA